MSKRKTQNPNSLGYTNALLEDVNDKFQIILEATKPIPEMQEQISEMLEWKSDIKLIPVIFEEVGSLRRDVEVIKEAMNLLDRHDKRLDVIEQRLTAVERHLR